MKQTNKIITFSMLLAAMASNANAQNDYPDSVANKVNVAFKAVDKEDLLGGVASVNMVDLTDKSYSTYATSNLGSIVATDGWSSGGMLVLVDGVPRDLNNVLPSEIEQILTSRVHLLPFFMVAVLPMVPSSSLPNVAVPMVFM